MTAVTVIKNVSLCCSLCAFVHLLHLLTIIAGVDLDLGMNTNFLYAGLGT